ncbi:MAG: MscS family rane protein [Clostridia bacterium]|nr:MscS family rane protein [Clostridia bacterium]
MEVLMFLYHYFGKYVLFKILEAVAIFFFFILTRNLFLKKVFKIISKVTERTDTKLDDEIVEAFEKPLRKFIILLGAYLALRVLPLNTYQDILVSKIFRSGIVALIAWGLYNLTSSETILSSTQIKNKFDVNNILVPFLSKSLRFTVVILAIMIIAVEWNYNINGLITGLGLGGLAFALAAKDTLSNIFGGIVIIADKPFGIRDWIKTPSVEGIVEDITFRSTKIRTFAQALVTVPNSTLANEPITNWSRMGKRRITFHLGVTYDTSKEKLEKCIQALRKMLNEHPQINKKKIFVNFERFNDSSLDILLYFFTNTTDWGEYLNVREDINFKIMEILEQEGVSIAFPTQSIYINKEG